MNFIKYKDHSRVNLDNIMHFYDSSDATIYFYNSFEDAGTCWNFENMEERDRVLALIDKAANCKDLGAPVAEDLRYLWEMTQDEYDKFMEIKDEN